jgi:CheY-like chemotaxis protein
MGQARPQILVVEDEKQTQRVLAVVLDQAGYGVEFASDGLEGLLKIESRRPQLVILDLMLPVIDGWEVLRRLQKLPDAPPVVVLSGYLDRARATEAGASASLSKPFTIQDLVTTCAQVLSARGGPPP